MRRNYSNQTAGSILLKNKYVKLFIFLLYTWFIFVSSAFISIPLYVIRYGFGELGSIILFALFIFSLPFGFIYLAIDDWDVFLITVRPSYGETGIMPYLQTLFGFLVLFLILFFPFRFWWKRQTIFRAYVLAAFGMVFSPAVLMFGIIDSPLSSLSFIFYVILWVCLFYLFLGLADKYQKKYWPDNKIANAIRLALKWPCPRS